MSSSRAKRSDPDPLDCFVAALLAMTLTLEVTMAERIGFVGLGLMGQGFTKRLVASGFRVVGCDVVPEKVRQAAAHGVVPAESPAEVAGTAEVVMLSVMSPTGGPALEEAGLGRNRVAHAPRHAKAPGHLFTTT